MNAAHFDGTVKCSILSFTCFINHHAIAVASYFVYRMQRITQWSSSSNSEIRKHYRLCCLSRYDVAWRCHELFNTFPTVFRSSEKISRQRNSNICSLFKSINDTLYRKRYCCSAKNTHWIHCKGADFVFLYSIVSVLELKMSWNRKSKMHNKMNAEWLELSMRYNVMW